MIPLGLNTDRVKSCPNNPPNRPESAAPMYELPTLSGKETPRIERSASSDAGLRTRSPVPASTSSGAQ